MATESILLQVRMSLKLKQQFEQICQEREISMSDATRDLIANLVRTHKRQTAKSTKEEE